MNRVLVLASRNAGKLRELHEILAPYGWALRAIGDYDTTDVEESAPTFVENALLKARHASAAAGLPAIADDSGLEVDALRGAPGVHSARYAGIHGDDAANNTKLLAALRGVPDAQRSARFVCAMVYLRHPDDPTPLIALGRWEGRILDASRGADGFGYDPLFFVPDCGCSAAELGAAQKNARSHRGQALRALCAALDDTTTP
ncbi:MAG: RdgB/HAM1 family non-canonical purine NTP pyrophosphatase [Nevskiaceae bacterium]|nr:MAG: RdgB/HAM1 family non-canonical purine NTP pyrophosphatase [Nevskiaceae bacterium]TBR71352.1 MAG: RdgB/HAM1 family non-canonical purine NTP pyrophosphatase [Nevskiaceae bacterium]